MKLPGLLWWVAGLVGAVVACAHDPGISTAQGEFRADTLVLTTGFAPADAEQLLPPSFPRTERWGQAEFDAARDQLLQIAPQLWELRAGETPLVSRGARVELLPGDSVSFQLVFPLGPTPGRLTLRAPKLVEFSAGHRQFVIISDERGSVLTKKLLSAKDYTLEIPAAPSVTRPTTEGVPPPAPASSADALAFWAFIRLGVEHIWTGYDHLLFLFALLIVCRSLRSIITIVSCFTLAHSLTLALATLNVVNLPSRLVEPAIAASIVFVGVENLWRRGAEPRGRWAVTFAFGLIHGFGFASVLRDLGVGSGTQGIAMPLFTFNLGVEIGQIAVAVLVLPLVWWLRKREQFVRLGVPIFSALVALAGLYWFLMRTALS